VPLRGKCHQGRRHDDQHPRYGRHAIPSEFAALIAILMNRVPNIDKAVISVHCHNDLGLGVANSLAAVAAGARQVECTINGIGERAGTPPRGNRPWRCARAKTSCPIRPA